MMTRRSLISNAELTRLAKLSKAEGVSVEVERDGLIVRVKPLEGPRERRQDMTGDIDDWRASSERVDPPAEPKIGKGGYPVPASENDPMQEWYDKVGFDPHTMNRADMERLRAEHHDRWLASIPNTKVSKREIRALKLLAPLGIGKEVTQTQVKGCGDDTLDRLCARGFAGKRQTCSQAEIESGKSHHEVWLLKPGLDFIEGNQR